MKKFIKLASLLEPSIKILKFGSLDGLSSIRQYSRLIRVFFKSIPKKLRVLISHLYP